MWQRLLRPIPFLSRSFSPYPFLPRVQRGRPSSPSAPSPYRRRPLLCPCGLHAGAHPISRTGRRRQELVRSSSPVSPHTPRKLLRRVGSDITNLHSAPVPLQSSPKREGRSFALMEKDLRAYDALKYGDKQRWLNEHRLTYDKLHDYRRQVNARLALPEEDRPNLQRRRLKSGGRKARLPKDVEDRICVQ
jgi:hypothetical protein